MSYARILGTGRYLPEKVLTNHELAQLVDTSDEWITTRTGISQRHIAADGETTGDLAEQAARRALDAAGVEPSELDLIVVGTTTPDIVFPSTACLLQKRFGIGGCAAMDVNAACSGFIYALSVAERFIRTDGATKALVIGAETLSRMMDWTDRSTCVLFGDGAGAAVLGADEQPGVINTHVHADGNYSHLLYAPVGVSRGFKAEKQGGVYVHMKGREVFRMAVRTLGRIVRETLKNNGLKAEDVDWLIPHQANHRIIEGTAQQLGLSMDRVILSVSRHGNTSAASVPLALDEAIRSGHVKRGELLLLEAFGGGFTWGSALIRY